MRSHVQFPETYAESGAAVPFHQDAQSLAIEAVLGILARGRGVDEQSVCEWITTALSEEEPRDDMVNRAMFFARRMLYGPLPLGT